MFFSMVNYPTSMEETLKIPKLFFPDTIPIHADIMTEITPQLTNNCSETLNTSLKQFYTSDYLPKYKLAEDKISMGYQHLGH